MFEGFLLRYVAEVISIDRGCIIVRLRHMVDVRIYDI
jgi:hypothetical protein